MATTPEPPAAPDNRSAPGARLDALLRDIETGPAPVVMVVAAGRRVRRRRVAAGAAAAALVVVGAVATGLATAGPRSTSPDPTSTRELVRAHGQVCPGVQPIAPGSDGSGNPDAGTTTPILSEPDHAWVCQYRPLIGPPGADEDGRFLEWRLQGFAVSVERDELAPLAVLLDDLEPGYASQPCPADLGPRWLLVTESRGDLTGVAVDAFGCRDVRLTDNPQQTEPGTASEGGIPGGVFNAPDTLLPLLQDLHAVDIDPDSVLTVDISDREIAVADQVVRTELERGRQEDAQIISAFTTVRTGTVAQPNTGTGCTSGRLLAVTMVGTFPKITTSGTIGGPDGKVKAVELTADAESGDVCQFKIMIGEPKPVPAAVHLLLP